MTEVIKILSQDDPTEKLMPCAEAIKNGRLVVFPTETVYGLGADALNSAAAESIFKAKGRPSDNPLIIHIANPAEAEKYTYTNALYYKLAEAFMPGPLTLILEAKDNIPMATRGGLSTVAVRCPSHPIARKLIEMSGVPIAAPSANISGSPSPTKASHVIDDMYGRVDYIIDGGDCDFGLESTILKISDDDTVTLLRPGKITVSNIEALGIKVLIADAVTGELKAGEVALSPGMKYRHYAPKAPVILLDGIPDKFVEYISKTDDNNIAVICYSEILNAVKKNIPNATVYDFGSYNDDGSQAHNLFSILRDADKLSFTAIYAPLPKKEGVSLALYNRMIRAAAHKIIRL